MAMQHKLPPDFYDIYPLWHKAFWQTATFYWFSALALLTLSIGLGLFFFFRRKKKKIMPHERASQLLHQLLLVRSIKPGDFYSQITTIVRNYLQEIGGIDLAGKTDYELIAYLRNDQRYTTTTRDVFIQTLTDGLAIKFAQKPATAEQLKKQALLLITIFNSLSDTAR